MCPGWNLPVEWNGVLPSSKITLSSGPSIRLQSISKHIEKLTLHCHETPPRNNSFTLLHSAGRLEVQSASARLRCFRFFPFLLNLKTDMKRSSSAPTRKGGPEGSRIIREWVGALLSPKFCTRIIAPQSWPLGRSTLPRSPQKVDAWRSSKHFVQNCLRN